MSKSVKRRFAIAGMALLHVIATTILSFSMLGFILRRHHYGLTASEAYQENIVSIISQTLEFPLMPISRFIFGSAANSLTPLIWLGNGILWAFFVYTVAALIRKKFRYKSEGLEPPTLA